MPAHQASGLPTRWMPAVGIAKVIFLEKSLTKAQTEGQHLQLGLTEP